MILQGEDVVDEPVAAVARPVGRDRRVPGATQVKQDQAAVPGQAAEVAQVRRRAHRPARQADQRVAVAADVIGEPGSFEGVQGGHGT